jgi:hypothetical protein
LFLGLRRSPPGCERERHHVRNAHRIRAKYCAKARMVPPRPQRIRSSRIKGSSSSRISWLMRAVSPFLTSSGCKTGKGSSGTKRW